MRRTPAPYDRLTLSYVVACIWLVTALWLSFEALGQAPGPEVFHKTPTTPMELWDAADYLVRTGQAARAVPYLNQFLQAQPDDDTLLKVRDRYGMGSVLRLDDYPETRPIAKDVVALLSTAQRRHATRPDRIESFIAALTKTSEEQDYAVERLREAGPDAVPFLVRALERPGLGAEDRALIVGNMGRLDTSAVPPLIATLDSPNMRLAADAAAALGALGDTRAVPALTYVAARPHPADAPADPARDEARRAIARLTHRPYESQPRSPVRVLTDEARRYHVHAVTFPPEPLLVWTWDANQQVPVSQQASQSGAEGYFGMKLAREALEIDPADVPAQVVFLGLALEKAVEGVGPAAFPVNDPSGAYATALAAGPDVLGQVVRSALADGKSDLAAAAVTALGQVADRNALATDRRVNPLIEALTAPSRRVQFAAARALVALEPRRPFAGSSQVVPILTRFVTNQSGPRALVIDGNTSRGGQLVGFLKELGYDATLALTGDDGFRRASESADIELILIDNHLIQGDWRLTDTLANLRGDARTAGVPIYIVGPRHLDDSPRYLRTSFPGVKFLVTPTSATLLEQQLGGRPSGLSDAERSAYARAATTLLALIAARPGSPYESDLSIAGPDLSIALNAPAPSLDAAAALSEVPMPDAQRGLADVVLDPSKPAPVRLGTAGQLVRSIQRFGPLMAADQETRVLAAHDQERDPALRTALAAIIGALRPKPGLAGLRIRPYGTAPAPAESAVPGQPSALPTPEATSPASEISSPTPPAPEDKP